MASIKEIINFYGLAFMLVIMIPNIIFAVKNKDGFENLWKNKKEKQFFYVSVKYIP